MECLGGQLNVLYFWIICRWWWYLPNASEAVMLTHQSCQIFYPLLQMLLTGIFAISTWFRHSQLELCRARSTPSVRKTAHARARAGKVLLTSQVMWGNLITVRLWFSSQRRSGPHRLLHRDRRHDGAHQAREDHRHLRPRHADALPAELHGPDGGPVHLHSRRAAGGGDLWEHRGPRKEPVLLHPEADADRARRECHRHGAGVQGEDQVINGGSVKKQWWYCNTWSVSIRECYLFLAPLPLRWSDISVQRYFKVGTVHV